MTREEAIKWIKYHINTTPYEQDDEMLKALEMAIKALKQESCKVSEYDKDHIWYKGRQYISLRRFLEVKAEQEPSDNHEEKPHSLLDAYFQMRAEQEPNEDKMYFEYMRGFDKGRASVQPCDDAISRQAVLDINESHHGQMPNHINHQMWQEIKALPPVRPQEQTGHWRHYEGMLICSECGAEFYDDIMEYCGDDVPRCCPNCRAKMVEPQESEG